MFSGVTDIYTEALGAMTNRISSYVSIDKVDMSWVQEYMIDQNLYCDDHSVVL